MTYRDRRLARADRLRGWADKREARADADHARAEQLASIIPLGQPILVGHYSEGRDRRYRSKISATYDRAHENATKARSMSSRADEIERQAAGAIYNDDPDAIERLVEKIARLEAQRDDRKARNAAYRKEHRAELAALTPYGRNQALPFPSYAITNLTGNIGRLRKRLADLERKAAQ